MNPVISTIVKNPINFEVEKRHTELFSALTPRFIERLNSRITNQDVAYDGVVLNIGHKNNVFDFSMNDYEDNRLIGEFTMKFVEIDGEYVMISAHYNKDEDNYNSRSNRSLGYIRSLDVCIEIMAVAIHPKVEWHTTPGDKDRMGIHHITSVFSMASNLGDLIKRRV